VTEDEILENSTHSRDQARDYVVGEITRYSVDILEFYSDKLGKSEALAITIESLSEALGSMISLVKEEYQQEVVSSAGEVIQQGLISQQKLIAEMAYGMVGHA
jgi:hypothetical protein